MQVSEGIQVAKSPKTLHVPSDLLRIIEWFERQHGPTFTRMGMAAFLEFFFCDSQPDRSWLDVAIALEKGETTVPEAPLYRARKLHEQSLDALRDAQAEVHYFQEAVEHGEDSPIKMVSRGGYPAALKQAKRRLITAKRNARRSFLILKHWEDLLEPRRLHPTDVQGTYELGDKLPDHDQIAALIKYWSTPMIYEPVPDEHQLFLEFPAALDDSLADYEEADSTDSE